MEQKFKLHQKLCDCGRQLRHHLIVRISRKWSSSGTIPNFKAFSASAGHSKMHLGVKLTSGLLSADNMNPDLVRKNIHLSEMIDS